MEIKSLMLARAPQPLEENAALMVASNLDISTRIRLILWLDLIVKKSAAPYLSVETELKLL